jgi:excinuclease UvrABC nuclease subunit
MDKCTWLNHEFHVDHHGAAWNDVPGIYIFCGINAQNQWAPLYIGQAESFAARLPTHERWQEATQLGATHVHAIVVPQANTRQALEAQLIQAYQPRLNIRLK